MVDTEITRTQIHALSESISKQISWRWLRYGYQLLSVLWQ